MHSDTYLPYYIFNEVLNQGSPDFSAQRPTHYFTKVRALWIVMLGGIFLPSSTLFVLLRQHDFPLCVPGDWRASIITSCNFFSCLLTCKWWQWWEKLACCALTVLNPCVCHHCCSHLGRARDAVNGDQVPCPLPWAASRWLWKPESHYGRSLLEIRARQQRPCQDICKDPKTRSSNPRRALLPAAV